MAATPRTRITWKSLGKHFATYPAYLCPLHCGGAVSHSRLRTTILHSECGDCKRFCEHLTTKPREPRPDGLRMVSLSKLKIA